ncbi:ankyrin repeat domain-containing protein [Glaesserella parasuis]|uniref:ankyrin repeat domain-containing protein n=2 Tax=Glaesserella parasuis TaxID=738 RepID=UPI002437143D|nr:ankyrin repeat domain-containing protein [Glaesserella parasuis]MDG6447650.1 ankyrin repeat domain-containing protein [Glaesserella parasuis]MDO9831812.1 ankyrin repeat domain-containing protein [Glaesserella parasuis]MDP0119973.1 ankyrin repeat domain-containing protein [Glaesserella parasuis]
MELSLLNELELEELIVEANSNDNINFLNEVFLDKKVADIKKITDFDKWNYLHRILCYFNPSVELVRFYISNGLDVNAQDKYGMTPLHYAMRSKNVDAAIALLNAGADPNIPNQDNLIPLSMIGYLPDRLDVLELMLEKGANVHFLVNKNETILESYKPTEMEPNLAPIYELMMKYA